MPVNLVQPANVCSNIPSAGAPTIPAKRLPGIVPVKPVQLTNVSRNMLCAGGPDIFEKRPAGIDDKPVQKRLVSLPSTDSQRPGFVPPDFRQKIVIPGEK